MQIFNKKKFFTVVTSALLMTACGGGADGSFELFDTDDDGGPVLIWVPSSTTEVQLTVPVLVYYFPLNTHYQALTTAYSSRIGKSYTTKERRCGNMSNATVLNGIYSADYNQVRKYLALSKFEGQNVVPVQATTSYTNVRLNGQPLPDQTSINTWYYNSVNNLYLGSISNSSYTVSTSYNYPDLVKKGDVGTSSQSTTYTNSSKSVVSGYSKSDWMIVNVTADTPYQYTARLQRTSYSYNATGTLVSRSTSVNDLTYNTSTGASNKTISSIVEDLAGTTTSQISSICN
jgi:hypothetical protein